MFCLILLTFLFWIPILSSKYVFVIKFACASIAPKTLAAKVLNSGVIIYFTWLW